jgi:hypothetical protein
MFQDIWARCAKAMRFVEAGEMATERGHKEVAEWLAGRKKT